MPVHRPGKMDLIALSGFDPGAERAEAVSQRMRNRLADSLRYIVSQAAGRMAIPEAELQKFLARLERGPVSPLAFGAYCDLVLALDSDEIDEAERYLAEIAAFPSADETRVVSLADPETDRDANRYRRLVDTDPGMPFTIRPPPPTAAAEASALIEQSFALMEAGNPALAAEIRTLIREFVLAVGPDGDGDVSFDGVSMFLLWGSIVLNVHANKTPLDMVQALAHESGHNLLFGLCADGPLHSNGDVERYASPLRVDPRPMDGIIHATYVTARMHQAMQRLLDAGILKGDQIEETRKINREHAQRFAMGLDTIERHARLTPLGSAVMDNAHAYMAAYL